MTSSTLDWAIQTLDYSLIRIRENLSTLESFPFPASAASDHNQEVIVPVDGNWLCWQINSR